MTPEVKQMKKKTLNQSNSSEFGGEEKKTNENNVINSNRLQTEWGRIIDGNTTNYSRKQN